MQIDLTRTITTCSFFSSNLSPLDIHTQNIRSVLVTAAACRLTLPKSYPQKH